MIAFHGTADAVDPFEGNGQAYWTYSVPQAAQRWAAKDACQAASPRAVHGNDYLLTEYDGCAANTAVELYAVGDEGHEWPGGPPARRLAKVVQPGQRQALRLVHGDLRTAHQYGRVPWRHHDVRHELVTHHVRPGQAPCP